MFAVLNEPVAAEEAIKAYMFKLNNADIESAAKKARLVEDKKNILSEGPWVDFLNYEKIIIKDLQSCRSCAQENVNCIEIEFYPKELLEG